METLGGFPNLPAMGSVGRSPTSPDAIDDLRCCGQYQLKPTKTPKVFASPAPPLLTEL